MVADEPATLSSSSSSVLSVPRLMLSPLLTVSPKIAVSASSTLLSVASTPRESASPSADRSRLFIIGAGLSRTGTDTLTAAMDILGFRAYHGGTVIAVRGIVTEGALWWPVPDFERIFDSRPGEVYSAAFDVPTTSYVKELMLRYPNYVVILSKRKSAEEWADSMMNTAVPVIQYLRYLDRAFCGIWKPVHRAVRFADSFFPGHEYGINSNNATFENLLQVYKSHMEYIKKLVPQDRLIEFQSGDGWEHLCKKLNVPIPKVPFPRKNERNGYQLRTVWTCWKSFSKNHAIEVLCTVFALISFFYVLMLRFIF